MTPSDTHERRLQDLCRFTSMLRNRQPFAAVKFNDGEWHAMAGRFGTNCDNHQYTKPLQTAMINAYQYLRPVASISDYIVNHSAYAEHDELASKLDYPLDWFVNFAFLHDLPYAGQYDCRSPEIKDFYRAIRDDTRPKVFVGPKRVQPESFLRTTHRIDVPVIDAFSQIGRLSRSVTNIARSIPTIFLLSCGFSSCILSHHILQENKNATIVDLGSALDPILFGKTRKSQLSTVELRQFYADFNCQWPEMPHYFDEIEGWFNFGDLYKQMVDRFQSGQFVEVGTWMGKSAAFMGVEIARSGKPIKLDCVDHFRGSNENAHRAAKWRNVKGIAANNLRPFWSTRTNTNYEIRTDNLLKIVVSKSVDAAKRYKDNSLEFVFIDAAHDEKSVRQDIAAWRPKIKPGGVLAGHDYSKSFPGVISAVDSMLPRRQLVSKNCWMVDL